MRRIEFTGVSAIDDEVLRRELLQLEAAYLNTTALDRSLARLERLPYVSRAVASVHPVNGDFELVDVEIRIVEAPARRYEVGGGYSGVERLSLHGHFVHENLAGKGRRLAIGAEGSELHASSEISYTDPYARIGGVSRTIAVATRRIARLTVDSSRLDTDVDSARLEYSYRVADPDDDHAPELPTRATQAAALLGRTRLSFGVELAGVDIAAGAAASDQLRRWVGAANGGASAGDASARASFTAADFLLEWRHDTRDTEPFATSGQRQSLTVRATLPGSDVAYYRVDFGAVRYWPLGERWAAALRARLGVGGSYGGRQPSLPPYMNFLAGGPTTVRGFRGGTLGPRDSEGRPYGGDLLVAAQAEWLTPWPRRWADRVRTGFFYDVGDVFSVGDTVFRDAAGGPLDYGFDGGALRQSIGVVARVRIPFGTLSVSYALPLDASTDGTSDFYVDEIERLQLTVGVNF